jgi:hypothetical protein
MARKEMWRRSKTQVTHWAATHQLSVTGLADPCQLLLRDRSTLRGSWFHHHHLMWMLRHQSGET